MVRIYEAIDVVNLGHWPLMVRLRFGVTSTNNRCSQEEFEAEKGGANSISWNTSPFDRATITVGSNEPVAKVNFETAPVIALTGACAHARFGSTATSCVGGSVWHASTRTALPCIASVGRPLSAGMKRRACVCCDVRSDRII
jgi:hypothetical protein